MDKTSIINELKIALQIALLKKKEMHEVALEKGKTKYAYLILVAVAVLGFIGQQLFGPFKPSFLSGLGMAIYQLVMMVVGIYVMSMVAKSIFKGSAKHDEFFRVMAYGGVVGAVMIVPMLGFISAIWSLVLLVVILKTVHKLTTGGAIGTIIISIIILGLFGMILGKIGLGYGYGGMKGSYKFDSFGGKGTINVDKNGGFKMDFKGNNGEEGGTVNVDNGQVKVTDENGDTTGTMKYDENGNLEVNTENGSAKMENGTVTVTGPDGKLIQVEVPKQ
jgi:hypothetical protein